MIPANEVLVVCAFPNEIMLLAIKGAVVVWDPHMIPIAFGGAVAVVPVLEFLRSYILFFVIIVPLQVVTPIPSTFVAVDVVLELTSALIVF